MKRNHTVIAYGPNLPSVQTAPNGTIFYKTTTTGSTSAGLYVLGFIEDNDANAIGQQGALAWSRAVSAGVNADTLGGLTVSDFQRYSVELAALTTTSGFGFYVKTGAGTAALRTLAAGSSKVLISSGNGTGANPTLDISEAAIQLQNLGGILPVAKGGTNNNSTIPGGVAYGSSATQISFSQPGSAGQVLVSNGLNAPVWTNTALLSIGSSTTATTATTANSASFAGQLSPGKTIGISGGATGTPVLFTGATNISIPITAIDATTVTTGVLPSGRLAGFYGTAQVDAASRMLTPRFISLTGDVSGSVVFDGTTNVSINTTVSRTSVARPRFTAESSAPASDNIICNSYAAASGAEGGFSASTGIFTAPKAGTYLFRARVYIDGNDAIRIVQLNYRNGVTGSVYAMDISEFQTFGGNDIRYLDLTAYADVGVGDQVYIQTGAGDNGGSTIRVLRFQGLYIA